MKNVFHVFLRMFTKFFGERPSKLAISLCVALFASTTAFAEEYISDVMVIGGDKDRVNFLKDSCGAQGWTVIDKDLNDNAGVGTDYVYLLYKKSSESGGSNGFITDFIIKTDEYPDSYIFNGRTYYRIPHKGSEHFEIHGGNLNSGTVTSSTNMRLYYTKEEFPDRRIVRDIAFTDAKLKSGYTTLGRNGAVVGSDGSGAMDLNEGAGSSSDYIYMHFATVSYSMDTPEYISDVVVLGGSKDEVNTLKERYASRGWIVIDQDLNDNAGAGTDYIYMAYKKSHFSDVNKGFITDFIIRTGDYPDLFTFNGRTYYRTPNFGDGNFAIYGGNLNSGTVSSSTNMWLYFTRESFPDKRVVSNIAFTSGKANKTKEGYTTLGENGAVVGNDGSGAMDLNEGAGSSSDYIYMHFAIAPKVNITFVTGLENISVPMQTVVSGSTPTKPTDLEREGYQFMGWFTTADGNTQFDFSAPITNDVSVYARWGRIVTFVTGDANVVVPSQTVFVGDAPTKPSDPERTGLKFAGWFADESFSTEIDFSAPITKNTTVYAKWEASVTFVTDDENVSVPTQTIVYGNSPTKPADLEREGYQFMGWYTTADGNAQFDFSAPISSNTTVYARWGHLVTFVTGDANVVVPTQSVFVGEVPIKPSDPERTGFKFLGWYAAESFTTEFDFSAPVTSNITVYAKWWNGDLSMLTIEGSYVAEDGYVLMGELASNSKISIANNATVTLYGVTINGENNSAYQWAGLTCEGNCKIILKGENSVKGFYKNYPGIYVLEGKTLIIEGDGLLDASSNEYGAGIGGGDGINCGNIVINGGTVTATGGESAAGIGSGYAASAGDITITDGVTLVTANKGESSPNSVGLGENGKSVGKISIGGVFVDGVSTSPFTYPANDLYTYTIAFDANGGEGTMSNQKMFLRISSSLWANVFTRSNHIFVGWNTKADGSGTSYADGTSVLNLTAQAGASVTLYAQWFKTEGNAVNLKDIPNNSVVQDGYLLKGTLGGNYKVSIADGATVTLDGVTINGENNSAYKWAGLTCKGDCKIILKGENTVKGFYGLYPGIYVPEGKTLIIEGDGLLDASSNGRGAGIGGGDGINCGSIVINGGTVTAMGGRHAAGIGSGYDASAGSITIGGGSVTATGGDYAAGIGSGYHYASAGDITINGGAITAMGGEWAAGIGSGYYKATAGDITINGGAVTATGGESAAGIGSGYVSTAGDITIGGGTVTAMGGEYAAGIGSGYFKATAGDITINGGAVTATGGESAAGIGSGYFKATAGDITITDDVTLVTANKGESSPNSVGLGKNGKSVGKISIGGFFVDGISESPYTFQTYDVVFDANGGSGVMENQRFVYNADPLALAQNVFTHEGFVFVGWNTKADGSGTAYADGAKVQNLTDVAGGKVTLYAQWAVPYIDENGAEQIKQLGEYTVLTGKMDMSNLSSGWYVVADEVKCYTRMKSTGDLNIILVDGANFACGMDVENITIYGQNQQTGTFTSYGINVKQNFTINGGNVVHGWIHADDLISINAYNYVRGGVKIADGQVFKDEHDNIYSGELTAVQFSVIAGNVLYPSYFVVTFDAQNGSDAISVSTVSDDKNDAHVLAPDEPTREGYKFMGWFTTADGDAKFDFSAPVTRNTTVYAQWNKIDKIFAAITISKDKNEKKHATIDGDYSGTDAVSLDDEIAVVKVELDRTLSTVGYATITLPFDIDSAKVKGAKQFLKFVGVILNEETKLREVHFERAWCDLPALLDDIDNLKDLSDEEKKEKKEKVSAKCNAAPKKLFAYTPYVVQMKDESLTFDASVTEPITLKKTPATVDTVVGNWKFKGTLAPKVWEEGDPEIGNAYGYVAGTGEFKKVGENSSIGALRSYLVYEKQPSGTQSSANVPGMSNIRANFSTEFLPANMDVVIVDDDENGKEHRTVIGKFNTRTGEFTPVLPENRTFDVKGRCVNETRSVGKGRKAKGVYYGRKR